MSKQPRKANGQFARKAGAGSSKLEGGATKRTTASILGGGTVTLRQRYGTHVAIFKSGGRTQSVESRTQRGAYKKALTAQGRGFQPAKGAGGIKYRD